MGEQPPGSTPIDDLSGLRQHHLRTRAELNAAEAENIRAVVLRYLIRLPTGKSAPFNPPWFRSLHRQMFGRVWTWAGQLRRTQTNLGVAPGEIEAALEDLEQDLAAWAGSEDSILVQSARLHHRAVQIHPFLNGNGRWARMLANIWLRRNREPLVEWPVAVVGQASVVREEYLAAIRTADAGDLSALVALQERFRR